MKNLEDLRKRKETLRKEIAELEDIAAFKNPKESLSAITHGFTDQFLVDKTDENGEHRLKLKPAEILSFATGGASENYIKTKINQYGADAAESEPERSVRMGLDGGLSSPEEEL